MRRRGVLPLLLGATLVLAAWLLTGRPSIRPQPDPPRDGLTELAGIEQLRTGFNADIGTTRLILILSPT